MSKRVILLAAALVAGVLVFPASAIYADIPKLINYQGMLTDNSGNPLNGSYSIAFKIYNAESDGIKRWEETQSSVSVTDGLFNVTLGSVTPINLDFSEDYWLEVTVGGEQMPSRLKFTSVGYAYRAQKADTASVALSASTGGGWVDAGSTVRLQTSTDNVGIGTSSPNARLEVNGQNGEAGLRVAWGSSYPLLYGEFKHTGSGGLKINARAGGGWADMSLQTEGTTRMFIESGGNVGIGTTTPGEKLEVSGNLKVTGAYKGNIGPNNGAPFPRPAYDSGWLSINQGQILTLMHNIGGNVDNYVVDLQFKSGGIGINQFYYGENTRWTGAANEYKGAVWEELTSASIRVHRAQHDTVAPQIRVRIWVYQ